MAKYSMEISLNVLNHLGIRLYSNTPAVLSEAIANAWDAGAKNVKVKIENEILSIEDDGIGMNETDLNKKFLLVGYQKRENGETVSPITNRKVMGRKGIGKLSLFSIANIIEVHTSKEGYKSGLTMNLSEIQSQITNSSKPYEPKEIHEKDVVINHDGTLIILKELKKNVNRTEEFLRKRIARRFGVIDVKEQFDISINNKAVTIQDRMYFDKLQAIWYFGEESKHYSEYCDKDKCIYKEDLKSNVNDTSYQCFGWIGTVENSGHLKEDSESLNKISILVRGKVALEDMLSDFPETGLFAKYLIGEIHADFLDEDEQEDIATSSRQDFQKDDPRYQLLKNWVREKIKSIQKQWDSLRNEEGAKKAIEIPAIKEWMGTLSPDSKDKAKKIFGKINQIVIDSPEQKKLLFQQSVIAFEYFKHKDELSKLTNIDPENIQAVLKIFSNLDNLESAFYYKIVSQRLEVIKTLESKVKENQLEKTIQQFLFDHLWLLDPSWERAAGSELIEKSFQEALESAKLTKDEQKGRVDIRYKTSSGSHIIIELKKPDIKLSANDLIKQVNKYKNALTKAMNAENEDQPIRIVCVLGKLPSEYSQNIRVKESTIKSLEANDIKIILYNDLLNNAKKSYQEYLKNQVELGKIQELIQKIEQSAFI